MAATFQWWGEYGATGAPSTADLGVSGNLFNFKTSNSLASAADYTSYPITAGSNSYDVWLKGHYTGTFNKIQNGKFYKSSGTLGTGETIKFIGAVTAYHTPVTGDSSYASADVPTSSPGSANVSFSGSLAGNITADGYSDFIVTQLRTTTASEAGDTETFTFTLKLGSLYRKVKLQLREFGENLSETIPSQAEVIKSLRACVETMCGATNQLVEDIGRTAWRHAELGRNILALA